ncbi:hypothetical protein HMPREF1862_01965 [Varibaculum cambriense]|uniref:Uncharacterized protein n=1 Tax=Varibaculum cambriense TaxID=184870 RepID=A0AB34WXC0_9ACTO|nr:hypothetical protein HMPREF1862_01965 [Varibaculum cambriense]
MLFRAERQTSWASQLIIPASFGKPRRALGKYLRNCSRFWAGISLQRPGAVCFF